MATPKEMVDARLKELGLTPTDLGLRLGYKNGFQGYHDLFVSGRVKLTPKKLEAVAELLNWPKGHFDDPDSTRRREVHVRRVYEEFARTEIGRSLNPDTLKTLESMRFLGEWLPTVQLYQAVSLLLDGRYTMTQLGDALDLEEADRAAVSAPRTSFDSGMKKRPKSIPADRG